MRVLLTGAGGFIGRHVAAALVRHGIDTVTIGRRPAAGTPFAHRAVDLLAEPDLAAVVADLGATHLLHLAWYAEHGLYWTSPLNLRWVDASVRLVEAFAAAGGRKVVAAGTCAEYDWSHGWCREATTPLAPATLYGTAKDATRRLLAALCADRGIAFAWGRVFLPYGAGESEARLVPSLIAALTGRRPPFAVNAIALRDFLHVDDVAEAFLALLADEAVDAYNIASGRPVAIADLVVALAGRLGGDADAILALAGERPGDPALLAGDSARLRSLGWRPALSLLQGLDRAAREDCR